MSDTTETGTAAETPAPAETAAMESAAGPADGGPDVAAAQREAEVVGMVSQVYDPEIPVNIYELGLIYDIAIKPDGLVAIEMTLTSPACPVAGSLPGEVAARVRDLDWVTDVDVELVWDPPWTPELMSEGARLELGFM